MACATMPLCNRCSRQAYAWMSAATSLQLEDVDFGECSGRIMVRHGKGNNAHTIPLNASARQALAEYLASRFGCDPTIKAVAARWPRPHPRRSPPRSGRARRVEP